MVRHAARERRLERCVLSIARGDAIADLAPVHVRYALRRVDVVARDRIVVEVRRNGLQLAQRLPVNHVRRHAGARADLLGETQAALPRHRHLQIAVDHRAALRDALEQDGLVVVVHAVGRVAHEVRVRPVVVELRAEQVAREDLVLRVGLLVDGVIQARSTVDDEVARAADVIGEPALRSEVQVVVHTDLVAEVARRHERNVRGRCGRRGVLGNRHRVGRDPRRRGAAPVVGVAQAVIDREGVFRVPRVANPHREFRIRRHPLEAGLREVDVEALGIEARQVPRGRIERVRRRNARGDVGRQCRERHLAASKNVVVVPHAGVRELAADLEVVRTAMQVQVVAERREILGVPLRHPVYRTDGEARKHQLGNAMSE